MIPHMKLSTKNFHFQSHPLESILCQLEDTFTIDQYIMRWQEKKHPAKHYFAVGDQVLLFLSAMKKHDSRNKHL